MFQIWKLRSVFLKKKMYEENKKNPELKQVDCFNVP